MKTTVHTGKNTRFVVAPVPEGLTIRRELRSLYRHDAWDLSAIFTLTPDQAGALIFGMEQALEVAEVRAQGAAVSTCPRAGCPHPAGECTAGQLECLGASV